jgi:hypothetical protein
VMLIDVMFEPLNHHVLEVARRAGEDFGLHDVFDQIMLLSDELDQRRTGPTAPRRRSKANDLHTYIEKATVNIS